MLRPFKPGKADQDVLGKVLVGLEKSPLSTMDWITVFIS
jgi:hypothetical protein